jgi:transcription elongation factor Elf1
MIIVKNVGRFCMNIKKGLHEIDRVYICLDCIFTFTIHTNKKKSMRYTYCPSCGDCVNVELYEPGKKEKNVYNYWQDWEMELVDRIIANEIKIYQVAYKTNRTPKSVRTRLGRRKEELGIE